MLLIIPSKGRWKQLEECIATLSRSSSGIAEVMIVADKEDDWESFYIPPIVRSITFDTRPMLPALNDAIMEECHNYEVLGFIGDDVRLKTLGWDLIVMRMLADKIGIVYGRDGIQNENLPTHPFFSSWIPRTLGVGVPGGLQHFYFDNYNKAIGQGLGCLRYVPELDFEHLHHSTGKSGYDNTYRVAETYEKEDTRVFRDFERCSLPHYLTVLFQGLQRTTLPLIKA